MFLSATEKSILETLEEENQELAVEIKKLMFTFDDVIMLDDRAIQTVLKEIDLKSLTIALKGANEEVKTKILNNLSSRASDGIREKMEFMGPVRVKQVEEEQQKIVAVIRRLEESGEIMINRGGEDRLSVAAVCPLRGKAQLAQPGLPRLGVLGADRV